MITCIYLDMDGVICDMQRHAFRLFNLNARGVETAYLHTDSWDAMPKAIEDVTGIPAVPGELWDNIKNAGPEFWEFMPWTKHGLQILDVCEAVAPVVLMSTPTKHPASAAGKKAWINRELGSDYRFALTNCKHHFAHKGAVLVDDAQHNCDKFQEHGGRAFLWPQPWNEVGEEASEEDVRNLRERLRVWLEASG